MKHSFPYFATNSNSRGKKIMQSWTWQLETQIIILVNVCRESSPHSATCSLRGIMIKIPPKGLWCTSIQLYLHIQPIAYHLNGLKPVTTVKRQHLYKEHTMSLHIDRNYDSSRTILSLALCYSFMLNTPVLKCHLPIQSQQTCTSGPGGALPAHIRGHHTAGTITGKMGGTKLCPWICSCREASRKRIIEGVSSTYHPEKLTTLSWVAFSMACWVWRHSGYVLQTNFCSRHSSQLCCKNKPQRQELSSNMTSAWSWLGNSIRHAVAACQVGGQCPERLPLPCGRTHREAHSSQYAHKKLHKLQSCKLQRHCTERLFLW